MTALADNVDSIIGMVRRVAGRTGPLSGASDLIDDAGLESVQVMELVEIIEDEYDISFPLNDLADIRTIDDLAAHVQRLKAES